jgi:hypothetical protein
LHSRSITGSACERRGVHTGDVFKGFTAQYLRFAEKYFTGLQHQQSILQVYSTVLYRFTARYSTGFTAQYFTGLQHSISQDYSIAFYRFTAQYFTWFTAQAVYGTCPLYIAWSKALVSVSRHRTVL